MNTAAFGLASCTTAPSPNRAHQRRVARTGVPSALLVGVRVRRERGAPRADAQVQEHTGTDHLEDQPRDLRDGHERGEPGRRQQGPRVEAQLQAEDGRHGAAPALDGRPAQDQRHRRSGRGGDEQHGEHERREGRDQVHDTDARSRGKRFAPVQVYLRTMNPDVVIVMGVSGSGKTTVAKGISTIMGWEFAEGDAFHSDANVAKMRSGTRSPTTTAGPGSSRSATGSPARRPPVRARSSPARRCGGPTATCCATAGRTSASCTSPLRRT